MSILKRIKSPSLSNDFSLIIIFVVAFTAFLAIWFSHVIYRDYFKRNISLITSVAKKIDRTINDDFGYTNYQMDYISNQIRQKGTDQNTIRNLLGTFRVNSKVNVAINWNMFSWVNKNKFVTVDGTEGILSNPVDISKRDYLPYTIKYPNEMHIGMPVYGAVSRQWIIPAGMGVVDNKGKYVGSIIFGFDIGNLLYKLEKIIGTEGINFAILNKDQKIIAKSANFNIAQARLDDLIAKSKPDNPIISTQSIFHKEDSFIVNHKLDKYPLSVVVQYDNDFSYYQFWHEWNFYMIEFLIALIFITILLFWLKHRIISPIVELSNVAKLVSEGFLEIKIPHYKGVEANYLGRSLINIQRYIKRENRMKIEIVKAKEGAHQANISKTNFLNSTSHDLKNYIISISGLSKLILESKTAPEIEENEDLKLIKIIQDQSSELLHFLEDLLDTNQTQNGEFTLDRLDHINVNEVLTRIVLLNKNLAIKHKVFVKMNLEEDLPYIEGDVRRVKQIFTNLLSNALKYSYKDVTTTIKTQYLKTEKQIMIEIADRGIGMNNQEIELALSGKGKEIDKSNLNKEIDSYGIGLPIVKNLVELHKGKLEIESRKGSGTKVRLYFKAADSKKHHKSIKKRSILIAEDNKVSAKITTNILESVGHKITCVENGKEAVDILNKEKFDLILMDAQMPIMSGEEAAIEIRKINKQIPIVIFTADANSDIITNDRNNNIINMSIDKSLSKKELIDSIESLFDKV